MRPFGGLPEIEVEFASDLESLDLDFLNIFMKQMEKDTKKLVINASTAAKIDRDTIEELTGFRASLKNTVRSITEDDIKFEKIKFK